MAIDGWFPKLNNRGEVVSGSVEVYLGTRKMGIGAGPQWLTPERILYNNRAGHTIIQATSGEVLHDVPEAYNDYWTDQAGKWAGYLAVGEGRLDVYEGAIRIQSIPTAGMARFLPDLHYITPVQSTERKLIGPAGVLDTGKIVDFGPGIVMKASGVYTRTMTGTPQLYDDEGGLIVSDGWVMTWSNQANANLLRPVGADSGYLLRGDRFYPSMRLVGERILIASSASNGTPQLDFISIHEPRGSLVVRVTPPPPVVSIPPTKEVPPMSLQAPNKFDVVSQVNAKFPDSVKTNESQRGQVVDATVQALGGLPWGRKSRNQAGTDLNTDGLAYRRADGLFEVYDIISGANGGPTWDGFGPFKDGENGYFVAGSSVSVDPPNSGGSHAEPIPGLPRAEVIALMEQAISKALEPIQEQLNSFTSKAEALQSSLTKLGSRIDHLNGKEIDSGRKFGHSHPVKIVV